MGQAENNITKRIKDFLKSKDIWHVKYFANAFTSVGVPVLKDILLVLRLKLIKVYYLKYKNIKAIK